MSALNDCGHAGPYGKAPDGKTYCYACCGERDAQDMRETGRAVLYLCRSTSGAWEVTNWPGSLRFPVRAVSCKKHGGGFGSQRTDAWFTGPDGAPWHAINRGDMQIARCRRVKA